MKNYFLSLLTIICSAVSIFGQANNQTKINGVVKDQNGAVIVGSRVFALNRQTRIERAAVSSSNGSFAFDSLIPGEYEIRTAAEGFATQKQSVQVNSDAAENLEIVLVIGESRLTVTAEVGKSAERENVPQAVNVIGSN